MRRGIGIGAQCGGGILCRLILKRLGRRGNAGGIEHHPRFQRLRQRYPSTGAPWRQRVAASLITPTTKATHDYRPPNP
ncbi:hypothetical protein GCM10011505_30060 [Tistrella bauzanensis]|uniref:Uncharacterized protein n=1 Tax=Tistrella bauzanensis TaxID=657419 RepID=A0ABQ1IPL3_9PROT|nr:hypothetical protein GCM10011505_30060 [Tistrella bauzanensis]